MSQPTSTRNQNEDTVLLTFDDDTEPFRREDDYGEIGRA